MVMQTWDLKIHHHNTDEISDHEIGAQEVCIDEIEVHEMSLHLSLIQLREINNIHT